MLSAKGDIVLKKSILVGSALLLIFICIIIAICFLSPGIAEWFFSPGRSEERILFSASDDIKRVIIEKGDPHNREIYLLNSTEDIEVLKECFSRVSRHMGEGGSEEYRIKFINDCTLHSIPFPDLFSQNQIDTVNSFIKDENKKYQYTFQVKNSIDFQELKQSIYDNGNTAYLPYNSINGTKPSIELSYVAPVKNKIEYDKASHDNKLGEFKYDDYFIPFVDDLKEKGLYFDNSTCSFSGGSSSDFSREISIYLTESLTKDEIINIRDKSDESYVIDNVQGFFLPCHFLYKELEEYAVRVIFDEEQSNEELKAFCQKYNIDSFDYDKELLEFDEITMYYFKGTKTDSYRSLCLTNDLQFVIKEYDAVDFKPFTDKDPNFSIIEKGKISENDYREIRKILSNYNIMQVPNNLGIGGYEFDSFVYIGIKTNGQLYVCGGQDPYSNNNRFYEIRSQIMKIFGISF